MRVLLPAAVLALLLGSPPLASADTPPARTTWTFRVSYSTGQYTDSEDPNVEGPVTMYTGSSWRCFHDRMSLTQNGSLLAGFTCAQPNGTGEVMVRASCSATSEGGDFASAFVSDSTTKAWAHFTVSCVTKVARPAPSRQSSTIESTL